MIVISVPVTKPNTGALQLARGKNIADNIMMLLYRFSFEDDEDSSLICKAEVRSQAQVHGKYHVQQVFCWEDCSSILFGFL